MNQIEKQKWIDAGGPELQRTFEGIGPDSIVFDIGLYRGAWTGDIVRKYDSHVYGFEPVRDFYESAQRALAKCPKVRLFNFGLGETSDEVFIYLDQDSTSLIKESARAQMVEIESIKAFMAEYDIGAVDLASINIEGAEYDLLQYLIDDGLITKFKRLMIQFHEIGVNHLSLRKEIRHSLAITHKVIYSYDTVWDYWELLEGDSK